MFVLRYSRQPSRSHAYYSALHPAPFSLPEQAKKFHPACVYLFRLSDVR